MANLKNKRNDLPSHMKDDIEKGWFKAWCPCGDWHKSIGPEESRRFIQDHPKVCRLYSPVIFDTMIGTKTKIAYPVDHGIADLDHPTYIGLQDDESSISVFSANYDTMIRIISGEIDPRPEA